jgi:hypothetical protein
MPKALCLVGMIVAGLLLLMFGLDLALQIPPFYRMQPIMDIGMVVCAIILGYISWMTLKEQK